MEHETGTANARPSGRCLVGAAYGCAVVALFSGFVLVSRLGFASTLTLPDLAALRFGIGAISDFP